MTAKIVLGKNLNEPEELHGERLLLRTITLADANEHYLRWITNPTTNQFLESRFQKHSLVDLRSFVQSKIDAPDYRMFAIVIRENLEHIGNIILGPINSIHRRAEVGLMIGQPNHAGKGFATEAIELVRDFAFNTIQLGKLCAGCYVGNIGSIKAFQKAGFEIEGTLKKHSIYGISYTDCFLLAAFSVERESY